MTPPKKTECCKECWRPVASGGFPPRCINPSCQCHHKPAYNEIDHYHCFNDKTRADSKDHVKHLRCCLCETPASEEVCGKFVAGSVPISKMCTKCDKPEEQHPHLTGEQEWEEEFWEKKHIPSYPVEGGSAMCATCGKQAYDEKEVCLYRLHNFVNSLLIAKDREKDEAVREERKEIHDLLKGLKIKDAPKPDYSPERPMDAMNYNSALSDFQAILKSLKK